MAVGAHHIATKLLVRTCKNLRNLQIIFWVEKPLRFLLPTGLKMQKCGLASTMSLADVKKLKSQKLSGSEGSDIQGWGRGKVIQLLLKNDLVDELRLQIHPLIVGTGKKLFDDGTMAAFTLTGSLSTPSGVIIANYKRAGEVKTGTIGEK